MSNALFQHNKLRTTTKAAGFSTAVEEACGVVTLEAAEEPVRMLESQLIWPAGRHVRGSERGLCAARNRPGRDSCVAVAGGKLA